MVNTKNQTACTNHVLKASKLTQSIASVVAIAAIPSLGYSAEIEEIIVTATKRAETAQSIPVAVTALNGDSLEKLNVSNFDDYVQYLPNVTIQGRGPGQSEIYIRGASNEQAPIFISETNGSAPSVALYQDEQPVSFGGRNLDIYTTDLERVEVLAGPQGTLFGASSQAGTIRLITNKPKLDEFEGGYDGSFSTTSGGENSYSNEGYVNLPIIEDKFAVRIAAYNDRQGGYIDNILGSTTHVRENINEAAAISGGYIPEGATVRHAYNTDFVEDDFNDATYSGVRIGAKYQINDNWDVLVQHTNQTIETEGVFDYDPTLGDLKVERFYNDELEDKFGLTNWTFTGRVGALDLIYTGAFLDREVDSSIDYTGYVNGAGAYVAFYACNGDFYSQIELQAILNSEPSPLFPKGTPAISDVRLATQCFDPTNGFESQIENSRSTHEIRVSSDFESNFNFTAGLFFDDNETIARGDFIYPSTIELGFGLGAPPRVGGNFALPNGPEGEILRGVTDPTSRAPGAGFFNDYTRAEAQFAAFGELTYDFSDQFSFTFGLRYYDIDTTLAGGTATNASSQPGVNLGRLDIDGNPPAVPREDGFAQVDAPDNSLVGADGTAGEGLTFGTGNGNGDINRDENGFPILGVDSNNGRQATNRIACTIATGNRFCEDENGDILFNGGNDLPIPKANASGVIIKLTASWTPFEDKLFFITYSEGFRPPNINRAGGDTANNLEIDGEKFQLPAIIESDELDNIEIGWKTKWLNNSIRWNATVFFSEFSNIQTTRFDPTTIGPLVFLDNAADADITGIDSDFQWAASDNLTISGAFSIISTEITDTFNGLGPIVAPIGDELPFTPNFSGNIVARYNWNIGLNDYYAQLGVKYRGKSYSSLVADAPELTRRRNNVINSSVTRPGTAGDIVTREDVIAGVVGTRGTRTLVEDVIELELTGGTAPTGEPAGRFVQQSFVVADAAIGMTRDNWGLELFIQNLTDERAQQSISNIDDVPRFNVNRPRTIGLRFSYDFE